MIVETCPKCGNDLINMVLDYYYPPISKKYCPYCGWSWTGGPEEIIRIPFGGNSYTDDAFHLSNFGYNASPCKKCSNNPANGGSGICLCTFGQPKIT